MSEEEASTETEHASAEGAETWREVGDSFKSLGESLVATLRQTWENEEVRQHLRKGVDVFAEAVSQAVNEKVESEHTKQVREELGKAARTAQAAGAQAFRDNKPQLMASMRQLSAELQKLLARAEQEQQDEEANVTPRSDDEA